MQMTERQLEIKTLEEVESFKYLDSSFTAIGQAKDEISGRIGLTRSTFTRLKATLWSRTEISLKMKGRVYEALVRTILLYGCETWPVRVEDLHRLEVFDNDCLRCILRYSHRDRQRCSLRALPSIPLQRRLRWFGHAPRRGPGELIREVISPTPPPTWRKRLGGQLKTWSGTIKKDLALLDGPRVYGLRRWNRGGPWIGIEMAQDRRAWSAAVRDVMNALEAGQLRPG